MGKSKYIDRLLALKSKKIEFFEVEMLQGTAVRNQALRMSIKIKTKANREVPTKLRIFLYG